MSAVLKAALGGLSEVVSLLSQSVTKSLSGCGENNHWHKKLCPATRLTRIPHQPAFLGD